jgi:outer membrane beta-barrel protein
MDSVKRSIALGLMCGLVSMPILAQESAGSAEVVEPAVERRALDVAAIDTENFELTGFIGWMSVEDFESDPVYGLRFAYHINPHLFVEATYAASDAGTSTAERLGNESLRKDNDDDYTYYDASLGYNLLSETFVSTKRTWNSSFYVIGGVGSTDLAGEDEFTVNLGFGFKVLPKDNLSIRLDARDYMFESDASGRDKTTHNIQMTLNLGWYF